MSDQNGAGRALGAILENTRFEIVPFSGVVERVAESVPEGSTVTITCSPRHGIQRTMEAAEFLVNHGFQVVPHLAAGAIQDRRHLAEIAQRITDCGIRDVFAIGGDAQPSAGGYSAAAEMIEDLLSLMGRPPRIGIAGYPETHPKISREQLIEALRRKARYAAYIVTQMCFNPDRIRAWIDWLAAEDFSLPVVLGVPGAVGRRRLIEMSTRIGVGTSTRYLSKNRRALPQLLLHRRFTPDRLLRAVVTGAPASVISGLHLFTFNQLAETEEWRVAFAAGQRAGHRGS